MTMSGSTAGPGDEPLAGNQPDPDVAATDGATAREREDLGLVGPTWYVLLCAVPFAFAFLVPIVVIYQRQNAVPPVSASAAAWAGVGAGWLLWTFGTVFWLLGKVVLAAPRAQAPHAWAWWDRQTRSWVLVVLAWGVVATLAVLGVSYLIGRLAA
jgi:hypothetical protein